MYSLLPCYLCVQLWCKLLSSDGESALALQSITKDILNYNSSSTLNPVTFCSWNTIGYRATYNEAVDGVLGTPGLEFMKHGAYSLSNP
jgi:hypothetical protein